MSDFKEIRKERIVYKNSDDLDARPLNSHGRMREEVREHIYEKHDAREDYVVHDDRRDFRTRRIVRSEILSFRRGVYVILDIIQLLLLSRFFVELFSMSSANPFAYFIRLLTYPLLAPFGNISTLVAPNLAINWSILLAMLVYGFLAYLLIALFESGIRAAYRMRH